MAEDIRQIKRTLRQKHKQTRLDMPPDEKELKDRKITDRTVNLWAFRNNQLVLTYVSTAIEVDTLEIIKHSFEAGKTVAVPLCAEQGCLMDFYIIKSLDELHSGHFGVLEPDADPSRLVTDLRQGLCIVPALAYDSGGFRLGFGKGYYDRFLSGFEGDCVGLCYSDCIENLLPHGKYDRRIRTVVTDKNIYIH